MSTLTTWSLLGGSLGAGEILLIMVVILLLFGSRRLPSIARRLGRAVEQFRRAARSVSEEILQGDQAAPPEDRAPPGPPDEAKGPNDEISG